jgi:hypothetical protein
MTRVHVLENVIPDSDPFVRTLGWRADVAMWCATSVLALSLCLAWMAGYMHTLRVGFVVFTGMSMIVLLVGVAIAFVPFLEAQRMCERDGRVEFAGGVFGGLLDGVRGGRLVASMFVLAAVTMGALVTSRTCLAVSGWGIASGEWGSSVAVGCAGVLAEGLCYVYLLLVRVRVKPSPLYRFLDAS